MQREISSESLSHFFYALIAFFFIQGCTSGQKVDQQAILDEMSNREIRRVSDAQILEKALEIGNHLTDTAQTELQKNLLSALENDGISQALSYCSVNAMNIVAETEEKYHARIKRVSNRPRNAGNLPDSLERLILEAYQYSFENNLPLEPASQEENEQVVIFTKPIRISSPICLNCHGTKGTEITKDNLALLQELYPVDSATGYRLGELRGMWSIRIPKKDIVTSL